MDNSGISKLRWESERIINVHSNIRNSMKIYRILLFKYIHLRRYIIYNSLCTYLIYLYSVLSINIFNLMRIINNFSLSLYVTARIKTVKFF